jgi:hypothetical protein
MSTDEVTVAEVIKVQAEGSRDTQRILHDMRTWLKDFPPDTIIPLPAGQLHEYLCNMANMIEFLHGQHIKYGAMIIAQELAREGEDAE